MGKGPETRETGKKDCPNPSLIPRPSPAPVFDCLQYAKTDTASNQKLEPGKAWKRGYPKPRLINNHDLHAYKLKEEQ